MKQPYTKPSLLVREHIELLKNRGLQIPDEAYFNDPVKHTAFLDNISDHKNRSRSSDVFIKHFYNTYNDPYPPVWIIFEVLS